MRSKEDLAKRLEELRAAFPAPVLVALVGDRPPPSEPAPLPAISAPANDAAPELAPESGPLEVTPDPETGPNEEAAEVAGAPPSEEGEDEPDRIAGAAATFCAADNKIRVTFPARLDRDLYRKVTAAGFRWAKFQGCFVAPAWSPERQDLAEALAGPLEDEDMTPEERAIDRAERFSRYEANRERDARAARAGVERITDGIPMGQPILVGHHSERRARKDAQRIERGMRKAVNMWSRKEYWERRAAGVIALPKYKERADVRHRRIHGLESDLRKFTKDLDRSRAFRAEWAKEGLTRGAAQDEGADVAAIAGKAIQAYDRAVAWRQRWADHTEHRLAYERAMLGESGGIKADGFRLEVGGRVLSRHWNSRRAGWTVIVKVNRASEADGGAIVSVSTPGGVVPVETITDYKAPEEGDAAKVKAALKRPPLVNYPGEGFVEMTRARWDRHAADEKKAHTAKATETHGAYRYRMSWVPGGNWKTAQVFLTDAPIVERPPAPKGPPPRDEDGDESEAPSSEDGAAVEAVEGGAEGAGGASLGKSSASASPRPTSAPAGAPCGAEMRATDAPPVPTEPLTVALHSTGVVVLAKLYKGRPSAMTYANRTQASAAATKLGAGWEVVGRGRPLYVAKVSPAAPGAPAPHKAPAGAQAGRGEPDAERVPPPAAAPEAPPPSPAPAAPADAPPVGSLAAQLDADDDPASQPDPRAILAPVVDALVLARQFRANEEAAERRSAREMKEAAAAPFRAIEASLRGARPGSAVEVVTAPELFPTPPALAARLVTAAKVTKGLRVLEPSAGTGALVAACVARGASVVAVEVNGKAAASLSRFASDGVTVKCADFLTLGLSDLGTFDAVVMNPPFSDEVAHVLHALTLLNYGGTLTAICSAAVGFRTDRKYEDFRGRVAAMKGTIEDLPDGSFKPQTGVRTVIVTVKK